MKTLAGFGWRAGLAALLALGLAACGGNDALPPKTTVSKVYVMGDSLADVGTFSVAGLFSKLKFTVVDPVKPENSLIWTQLIASRFGLDGSAQCNFFNITIDPLDPTNPVTTFNTHCTNYAIGGARIVNKPSDTAPTVGTQMGARAQALSLSSQQYSADELVLIDGGGNDANDLANAYANRTLFAFLTQSNVMDTGTAVALLESDPTGASAGMTYMQRLADKFYNENIKPFVLDMGAKRVAVLNIPDITITPLFQSQIANLPPAEAAGSQTLVRALISEFNKRLKTNIGTDSRVALVDFYSDFQDEVANPTSYGLTNVVDPACTYDFGVPFNYFPCATTMLDATLLPPGKTAGWWKTYAFADGFHPTPYGHTLLAASVSRALARAGWL
jgi:outer membrane lipase/esterase